MTKKVNFYTVNLHESVNADEERDFKEIKDYIIEILYDEIIVGKFQKIIEPLQDKIISCQKCNEELELIRDFLLPLLMNGQVGF